MMSERENEERTGNAGLDLCIEPGEPRREPHPAAGQFEVRPGKIITKRVEAQLLDLANVHGRHVAPRTHRAPQSLMGTGTQQEPVLERLSLLSACGDG
ncbi:hypothetical protein ACVWW4_003367 [Bradyrhizobium sp. LB7.1]